MSKTIRALLRRLRGQPTMQEELTSSKLRTKYSEQGVSVGMHSYGCFDLARIPPGTRIGRYCSFAPTSQVFLRNHGLGFIGLTAYLYNETLGVVDETPIPPDTLQIEDDVWVGHNAVILPSVRTIGRGAVIAAGAVVTKPVPAYAIVAGNPARVIRMRFDHAIVEEIEALRWWELQPHELRELARSKPDLVFRPAEHFSALATTDSGSND